MYEIALSTITKWVEIAHLRTSRQFKMTLAAKADGTKCPDLNNKC